MIWGIRLPSTGAKVSCLQTCSDGGGEAELLECCFWAPESAESLGEAGVVPLMLPLPPRPPMSMWIRRSCKSRSGMAARDLVQASSLR